MRSFKHRLPSMILWAVAALGLCRAAWAQSPKYGLGRTPTPAEIRAWDISIGPEGQGLPQGSGSAKEGARIFAEKCAACHGATGSGGPAPMLIKPETPPKKPLPCLSPCIGPGSVMALHSPYATTIWDYIHRAMPFGQEGTLKPDEVYALTAFLLYKNGVIKEDDVLNQQTLPQVKMPNRNGYAIPDWKPDTPRPFPNQR
jgi:S-disulfanyl-L-cysteine oxidoreductase SoxD